MASNHVYNTRDTAANTNAGVNTNTNANAGWATGQGPHSPHVPADANDPAAHAPFPPTAGFRNPWYSPATQPVLDGHLAPPAGGSALLLHAKKQASFANQLPITYETSEQQQQDAALAAYINPPTRADNPFNPYYTSQDVALLNFPDRRMLAAVDGSFANPYGDAYRSTAAAWAPGADSHQTQLLLHGQVQAPGLGQVQGHVMGPGQGIGVGPGHVQLGQIPVNHSAAAQRRSSVAFGAPLYHAPPQLNTRYISPHLAAPLAPFTPVSPVSPHVVVPRMRRVRNKADLSPRVHTQPQYRRRSVHSVHILPTNALTVYLTETFALCQPQKFKYLKASNPKRVLTKPSEPKYNNGNDNEDSDYILYVNDMLGPEEGRKYVVLDLLGSGTFGQVVKCQNLVNQSIVAIKVVKSKSAYLNQSLSEVKILEFLNQNSHSGNFIRLLDTFMHKEHLCLVFELLASNLYELIKQNQFHGLNMKLVKSFTKQLLRSCAQLKNFHIIHCDLKPENILLCQPDKPEIKVIDFGSACFTNRRIYSYIQSRFYRSPEVILGLPYTESIDMWSLGCIVGELFLGLPMFPGSSEYNQIFKIVDMLGPPPRHMLEHGRNLLQFFEKTPAQDPAEKPTYTLKTYEQYVDYLNKSKDKDDGGKTEQPNKNYFDQQKLKDIILNYKMPSKKMTQSMIDKEYEQRHLLIDFLSKVLDLNPLVRLTPHEALKHPFVNDSVSPSFSSNSTLSLAAATQTDMTDDSIMKV